MEKTRGAPTQRARTESTIGNSDPAFDSWFFSWIVSKRASGRAPPGSPGAPPAGSPPHPRVGEGCSFAATGVRNLIHGLQDKLRTSLIVDERTAWSMHTSPPTLDATHEYRSVPTIAGRRNNKTTTVAPHQSPPHESHDDAPHAHIHTVPSTSPPAPPPHSPPLSSCVDTTPTSPRRTFFVPLPPIPLFRPPPQPTSRRTFFVASRGRTSLLSAMPSMARNSFTVVEYGRYETSSGKQNMVVWL